MADGPAWLYDADAFAEAWKAKLDELVAEIIETRLAEVTVEEDAAGQRYTITGKVGDALWLALDRWSELWETRMRSRGNLQSE